MLDRLPDRVDRGVDNVSWNAVRRRPEGYGFLHLGTKQLVMEAPVPALTGCTRRMAWTTVVLVVLSVPACKSGGFELEACEGAEIPFARATLDWNEPSHLDASPLALIEGVSPLPNMALQVAVDSPHFATGIWDAAFDVSADESRSPVEYPFGADCVATVDVPAVLDVSVEAIGLHAVLDVQVVFTEGSRDAYYAASSMQVGAIAEAFLQEVGASDPDSVTFFQEDLARWAISAASPTDSVVAQGEIVLANWPSEE